MPAKGQRRKQQIIDIAKDMFIKSGFQSTHIGQVCDQLKIARGTVYQYFGNKREILYAILEAVEEEFDDIFDLDDLDLFLVASPDVNQMREFVGNRIASCVEAIISEPIVIKLMYKEIVGIDDEVIQHVDDFIEYITKILIRDFEIYKTRGFYKKNLDSRITATLLIGGVLLMVHEYEAQGKDILKKEVVDIIAENFLFGVV